MPKIINKLNQIYYISNDWQLIPLQFKQEIQKNSETNRYKKSTISTDEVHDAAGLTLFLLVYLNE